MATARAWIASKVLGPALRDSGFARSGLSLRRWSEGGTCTWVGLRAYPMYGVAESFWVEMGVSYLAERQFSVRMWPEKPDKVTAASGLWRIRVHPPAGSEFAFDRTRDDDLWACRTPDQPEELGAAVLDRIMAHMPTADRYTDPRLFLTDLETQTRVEGLIGRKKPYVRALLLVGDGPSPELTDLLNELLDADPHDMMAEWIMSKFDLTGLQLTTPPEVQSS